MPRGLDIIPWKYALFALDSRGTLRYVAKDVLLALHCDQDLAAEIRQAAQADERSVSSFLRAVVVTRLRGTDQVEEADRAAA